MPTPVTPIEVSPILQPPPSWLLSLPIGTHQELVPTLFPAFGPADVASLYDAFITWVTTYATALNAILSGILTAVIIWIYRQQLTEIRTQSTTLSDQTTAIRAGIQPLLSVNDVRSTPDHPDRVEVDLENLGNEVAQNLQEECYLNVEPPFPDRTE